jgi:epoxyqueuosine reductase
LTADLKVQLRQEANAAGFDVARVTVPEAIGQAGERLMTFLASGSHGDMGWMSSTATRRRDPRALWPAVRTIVMLGISYAPERDPLLALKMHTHGLISCYAQGRDYHDVLSSALKRVAGALQRASGAEVKVFVDTAPLMEKPLAAAAGLGWQGKHTNLVSRRFGSWLFLGAILTSARIDPDAPETDHCGSCRRCLDVCPTQAFPAPYQLDARRCIAYLTIEHKGHIASELRPLMGNRVFGCDDCLAVCPWNKFAVVSREARFASRIETDNPPLRELLSLDDGAFRRRFAGTPVKRTGRDRFMRNVLIAAGNAGDRRLIPEVVRHLTDPSPLVRAMAVWALQRLAESGEWRRYKARCSAREPDAAVKAEWGEEQRP